jgi:ribosomal protein L7Ae-like RNA K-turn-binding protein
MDKALNYMALARKAGRIELGEEPVGGAARAQKARLVIVASDASDHTWRRALSFVAGTSQIALRGPFTKD